MKTQSFRTPLTNVQIAAILEASKCYLRGHAACGGEWSYYICNAVRRYSRVEQLMLRQESQVRYTIEAAIPVAAPLLCYYRKVCGDLEATTDTPEYLVFRDAWLDRLIAKLLETPDDVELPKIM